MALSGRRAGILQLVIQDYIESATPVASRHVVEKYDLPASSATIRHEMQALEAEGYLTHPHTSAGRVPSNRGYRHFVESLMGHAELGIAEQTAVRHQFFQAAPAVDEWAELAATVLAQYLGLLAVVAPPRAERLRLRELELISLNDLLALMIIVVQEARVIRQLMPLRRPLAPDELDVMARRITEEFNGGDADELRGSEPEDADEQLVIDALARALEHDAARAGHASVSGLGGMLAQPEFHDSGDRSLEFIELVERNSADDLIPAGALDGGSLRVLIGDDYSADQMSDCSLVVAPYGGALGAPGYVAVIGPTRMNYKRSVAAARFYSSLLEELLRTVYGGAS